MFDSSEPRSELLGDQWEEPWGNQPEDQWGEKAGRLPPGLAEMAPGPELGALLVSLADTELSGYDQVVVLAAHQRMASHHQAGVYAAMAAISSLLEEELGPEEGYGAAAAEIRAALRLTRRAADTELGMALALSQRLPMVLTALRAGSIDPRRAKVIVYGTTHLEEAAARAVGAQVIGEAPRLTSGQLFTRLRRLCLELDPEEATTRYREAQAERRVVLSPSPAGTAHLSGFDLSPQRAAAVLARITALAQGLRREGEERNLDQLRARCLLGPLGR